MSAGKHTPGPWEPWTDDDGKSYSVVSLSMTTKKTVCYIYGNRAQAAKKIDARLIAAAPDMLAALKECLDAEEKRAKKLLPGAPASTYCAARLERIRAAIARAEGRADA